MYILSCLDHLVFKFSQSEALRESDTGHSSGDPQYVRPPVHVNNKPRFPLCKSSELLILLIYQRSILVIPEKHRFKHRDAVKGKALKDNAPASQLISPKFFNFLPSLQSLPLLFGFEGPVKRPPPPPPSISSSFPIQKPGKPAGMFGHQSPPPVTQTRPEEALQMFNQGLDNFIQNPASLTQVPKPANR